MKRERDGEREESVKERKIGGGGEIKEGKDIYIERDTNLLHNDLQR